MRVLFFIMLVYSATTGYCTILPEKTDRIMASNVKVPILNTGNHISLLELSTIKLNEFEKLSGKHMSFGSKLRFKLGQRKLRSSIRTDGSIPNNKINKAFRSNPDGQTGFHLGGFLLGFLLPIVGIPIAYLYKDEKRSNRVKWAWIGLALWFIIYLVIVLG